MGTIVAPIANPLGHSRCGDLGALGSADGAGVRDRIAPRMGMVQAPPTRMAVAPMTMGTASRRVGRGMAALLLVIGR